MIESPNVAHALPGDQDPIASCLISATDPVEELRCIGNTDLFPNPACLEFKEQRVETGTVLVAEPSHVTVPFHQPPQKRGRCLVCHPILMVVRLLYEWLVLDSLGASRTCYLT